MGTLPTHSGHPGHPGHRHRHRFGRPEWTRGLCWLGLLGGLSACSPALNWRQVPVPGGDGLTALYPCRPEHDVRVVAWPEVAGGLPVQLLTCEVDDTMWALQYVQLPDVALVPAGMKEWRMVMTRNLSATRAQDLGTVQVPGMTPSAQAHAWRFQGLRPDGSGTGKVPVEVQTWHFFHGRTVFQASVWRSTRHPAAKTDEDMAQEFFRSFQFAQ